MTENTRLYTIMGTAATLLLIPFVAMQFTEELNWSGGDFFVAGLLLFGTGAAIELVLRKVKKLSHRLLICGAILLVLALIWIELAVGLFGTPFAGS
ncbi:MAG TPA: hypothetical protein VF145_06515 [Chitinophagaceae bacterium]